MGKAFELKVTIDPPDWLERFEYGIEAYLGGAQIIFRAGVFKFLEYEILTSRVKTGRMKSAWTPIMDAYNYPWSRSNRPSSEENPADVSEGMALGSFIYNPGSNPWAITVINSVNYAQFVEEKVGMSELGPLPVLLPKYEQWLAEGFEVLSDIAHEHFLGDSGEEWEVPTDLGAPST